MKSGTAGKQGKQMMTDGSWRSVTPGFSFSSHLVSYNPNGESQKITKLFATVGKNESGEEFSPRTVTFSRDNLEKKDEGIVPSSVIERLESERLKLCTPQQLMAFCENAKIDVPKNEEVLVVSLVPDAIVGDQILGVRCKLRERKLEVLPINEPIPHSSIFLCRARP